MTSTEAMCRQSLVRHRRGGDGYQKVQSEDARGPTGDLEVRTNQATTGCFQAIGNFFGSILNGSTLKGKIVRALLVGGAAAVAAFFLLSNPVGWTILGIGAAAFTAYLLGQLIIPTVIDYCKHDASALQMVEFKGSAWQRINGMRGVTKSEWLRGARGKNIEHVYTHPNTRAKVYLSALPNQNDPKFGQIFQREGIKDVFSINERWEVENEIGNSKPYTDTDYHKIDITYHTYEAADHGLIPHDSLDGISDEMEKALLEGRSIVVHCRAGVGRSSQLVAGNMIKYGRMDPYDAASLIRYGNGGGIPGRSQATIFKKLLDDDKTGDPGLYKFADRCGVKYVSPDERDLRQHF